MECSKDHPEATEDLNAVPRFMDWSMEKRKWVLKEHMRPRLEKRSRESKLQEDHQFTAKTIKSFTAGTDG